jgi:hypothetical protein
MALLVLGAFRRLLPRRSVAVCAKPGSVDKKKIATSEQTPGDCNLSLRILASSSATRFLATRPVTPDVTAVAQHVTVAKTRAIRWPLAETTPRHVHPRKLHDGVDFRASCDEFM